MPSFGTLLWRYFIARAISHARDFISVILVLITRESELESEARLTAVRTEIESESLREARLAADVYI